MHIRKLDPSTFQPSYGVTCTRVFPSPESGDTPFNAYMSLIEPGGASQLHRHHEGETFIILSGSGLMTVDDETEPVGGGDVIFMDPLTDHTLANASDTEQLLFLNVYWEDIKLLLKDKDDAEEESQGVRTLAYTPPPHPDGDLHWGYLSGPALSADMYIRHRRMLGDPAHLVLGTDDNRAEMASLAETRGETPQQTADHIAGEIAATLAKAHVDCGHVFRPNAAEQHRQLVDTFVRQLHANGHLVAKETPAIRSEISDLVPSGGSVDSSTDESVQRLVFPLEPHREVLEEYLRKVSMTTQHRALISRLMDGEMPDIEASRLGDWGIPVAVEGFDGQVLSPWLERLPGYLAGAAEVAEKAGFEGGWHAFWGAENARVVQFLDQDSCWDHGVLYPLVLKAFDADAKLPEAFVSSQPYDLDISEVDGGSQAAWIREMVDANSTDTVRCFAAHSGAEAEPVTYSNEAFAGFVGGELIGKWQAWLSDAQSRVDAAYDGKIPEAGAWTSRHLTFLKRLKSYLDQASEAYSAESFSPQRLTRVVSELVRSSREFGKAEDAWATSPAAHNERRTAVALEMAAVRTLAMIAQPLMPEFSDHLWACLGHEDKLTEWEHEPHFVTPGNLAKGLDGAYFPEPVRLKEAAAVA